MSTNQQQFGANAYGYGHVFIAPNATFNQPTMTINIYDENGNVIGTEQVDIPTYYQTVDTAMGRPVRQVKPLKGGTHSFSMFNTDENKGDFTNAKANIEAAGMIFGGSDFTLSGNVAYLIPFADFQSKFQYESPLN